MLTELQALSALTSKNYEILQQFITEKKDHGGIDYRFAEGYRGLNNATLLHYACYLGEPELVGFLLDREANPRVLSGFVKNAFGDHPALSNNTPLHWLVMCVNDIKIIDSILDKFVAKKISLDILGADGKSPLLGLVLYGYFENFAVAEQKLKSLLLRGVNINLRQEDGKTAIHLALDRKAGKTPSFNLEFCVFLLAHKARICMPLNKDGKMYNNAGEYALALGRHSCYDFLNDNKEPVTSTEKALQELQVVVEELIRRVERLEASVTLSSNAGVSEVVNSSLRGGMFGTAPRG